ncbi:trypsin-like peptidase domain-containing protein [Asanoa sp. WMMD1127]|uniref:S1C family serine protease n=1 Tax=Asanoa sp. WMMD1127 TaxID=3016107 RepID=UPI0024180B2C|nr:trypsin-like peptidase domain-containing protein [Asanoa sp. WMMD1127]MDG4821471.1 trypsin-like peptidase domain-containing protein [Asanoa sp. WMMD1127]
MTDLLSRTETPSSPWPPAGGPNGPGGPVPPWVPSGPSPSPSPSGGPRRGGRRVAIAAGALVLVLGGGVAGGVIGAQTDRPAAVASTAAATDATTVSTQSATLASVAARTSPSVVTIMVQVPGGTVEGSGVIVDDQGRILTNNHVVAQATGGATVQLSDGRTLPAQILRTDPGHDLALIQVSDASGLTPATLGDSDNVQVGDTVLAFGSPLGLSGTVTSGIVSALDRDAQDLNLFGLIQTDAPINSGNSGGPLVDAAGQVIAINVANASTSQGGGSIGIGFAIPIDEAQSILG